MLPKGGLNIQRSCKYCGKIHEEGFQCHKKPREKKKMSEAVKFRSSNRWQRKRKQIKQRDNYLCQICIRKLYGTVVQYNYDDVQVHHAVPIHKDDSLKLSAENLITLCPMHHAMCDRGEIPYSEVKGIIGEQENKRNSPPCL